MFKKILMVLFFSLVTSSAFAAEVEKLASKDTSVITQADVKKLPVQMAELNDRDVEPSQTPQFTDAWLILLALLGFVMLSNRSGV